MLENGAQAKVADTELSVLGAVGEEQVGRLDVPVQHAVGVQVAQPEQ
jgi:hypothetical protein